MSGEGARADGQDQIAVRAAIAMIAALEWRFGSAAVSVLEAVAESFGAFEGGDPLVQLLGDGRKVRLLSDLGYSGPDGTHWPVPAGITVDGASIPWPFWSLIGGPFEGRYRNASIVHDHYCVAKTRGWRATHRMFHDAMRCSGVAAVKAKIMYYAVHRFGPRWPDPDAGTNERIAAEVVLPPAAIDARMADEIASDAEAIYLNDLNLDEVEALADARDEAVRSGAEEGAWEGVVGADETERPSSLRDAADLARRITIVGGTGKREDLDVILGRAMLLPGYVLKRFKRKGVRIVACRESVTDFERSLRGVVPRGWERTGKTWDDVPGAYMAARNCVVIATIAGGSGRMIPGKVSGKHGSVDLLLHEALHGYDFAGGHAVLAEPGFVAARDKDFARLDDYERQAGEAGLQETFAESGAWFFAEPAAMRTSWPALHGYWLAGPSDLESLGAIESMRESVPEADGAIGTGRLEVDGAIKVDLRAEGPGGIIGHAQFTIPTDDPHHPGLQRHLFGSSDETREAVAETVVLFRP